MNKFVLSALTSGAFLISGVGVAFSQEKIDFHQVFEQMQEQLKGTAAERHKMIDKNGDGIVTREEYISSEVGINNMRNNLMFETIDTDKDGKISVDDYYTALSIRNYQLLVSIAKAEEQKAAEAKKTSSTQTPENKTK